MEAPPELYRGIGQFNAGQFFECHETLEAIWLAELSELRRLYQGILQIGVGFYHATVRKNYRGATILLQNGMNYCRPFAPVYFGIDLAALLEGSERALKQLEALGPENIAAFDRESIPKINYSRT